MNFNDSRQFSYVDILIVLFHSCVGIKKQLCFSL